MPYPVAELISEAFFTSGIVSRGFQQVAGDQQNVGLLALNEILTDTVVDTGKIPYFTTHYAFNAVPGQEMYFIPGMAEMETLVFFINTVRYEMRKNQRDYYFGTGRAENVESLPFNWHTELVRGGTNLFIYFFPDIAYPMVATGLFALSTVTLFQDLLLTYDQFYINYLQYVVAERLCIKYNFAVPEAVQKQIMKYDEMITNRASPKDMSMKKLSTLTRDYSINYGQVNFGHGWTVG